MGSVEKTPTISHRPVLVGEKKKKVDVYTVETAKSAEPGVAKNQCLRKRITFVTRRFTMPDPRRSYSMLSHRKRLFCFSASSVFFRHIVAYSTHCACRRHSASAAASRGKSQALIGNMLCASRAPNTHTHTKMKKNTGAQRESSISA